MESRWEIDDYAALGAGFGNDEFQALMIEWEEFGDSSRPSPSVLMKSEEGHPFILSTKSQDELAGVYRWKALAGLLVFLAGGVALGVTLTARLGG